jgi:hypothetical protein
MYSPECKKCELNWNNSWFTNTVGVKNGRKNILFVLIDVE